MAINIGLEVQQRIWGANGTILWAGAQAVANDFTVLVKEGASVGVGQGEAVIWDATNSVIPRSETTAAGATPSADLPMSIALYGLRTPAGAGAVNFLGVSQDPGGVGGGTLTSAKRIVVASDGSLVSVQTTATLLVVGTFVGSSATAGLVATVGVGVAANIVLGAVFKVNSVAAPGTGSTGWAGIKVMSGARVS